MACRIPARADRLPARPPRQPGPPRHFVLGATAQMLDWFKQVGAEPQQRAQEPHNPRSEPLSVIARRLGLLRQF
jgi:hypothetical protein